VDFGATSLNGCWLSTVWWTAVAAGIPWVLRALCFTRVYLHFTSSVLEKISIDRLIIFEAGHASPQGFGRCFFFFFSCNESHEGPMWISFQWPPWATTFETLQSKTELVCKCAIICDSLKSHRNIKKHTEGIFLCSSYSQS